MQHRLRHFVDDGAARGRIHKAGNPDAFAAFHEELGEREGYDQSAFEFAVARLPGGKRHRRRAIRPKPDGMGGFPFLLADIQMIVARRSSPVDALRWFTGNETAILPETFTGTCTASPVQAVDYVGCDTASLEHETRQGGGERSAFAIGTSDRCNLSTVVPGLYRHQPIRVFNCRITSGIVRPSARAENVSAMRCLRTGSARSSTSSIEGARRPSSSARARTASISD